MIEIVPNIKLEVHCLRCEGLAKVKDIIFQGMHVMADCFCPVCAIEFYHTLPIGHDFLFPISFSKDRSYVKYPSDADVWLAKPLIASMLDMGFEQEAEISVSFISTRNDSAILINCLDSCFGHVFTKLWNISYTRKKCPNHTIIVIAPVNMVWLLPNEVDEVWSVHLPLNKMKCRLINLDRFVKDQIIRFKSVELNHMHTHLDVTQVDLFKYLKTERFDLSKYASQKKGITFIIREDRFWHTNRLEELLFFACVKFNKVGWLRKFFCSRQNRLIKKTSLLLSNELNEIVINVIGFGATGKFDSKITDLRVANVEAPDEMKWCQVYAQSHLVIGVHGSNMLIPSALAAGFIEILPDHKIRHMGEDTIQPYNNTYSQFLGRHVHGTAKPYLVAKHAVSMIKYFPYLHRNQQETV